MKFFSNNNNKAQTTMPEDVLVYCFTYVVNLSYLQLGILILLSYTHSL